ncbi:MAG TPA: FtsX-like permease family protein [Steroidobacteraceae bacterium]|nr:FtsX-like permease family protein [Steroidobacteraceae bacterium]
MSPPFLRFAARNLRRDLRSGESLVLLAALIVAVASSSAVGLFTSRIAQGVARQATQILAADLRLESADPLPRGYFARAHAAGLRTAEETSFPTALFAGARSQLAAVNAVTAGYPLRGSVRIADVPYGPSRPTRAIPARGEVWLDARIAAQLHLEPGARLHLGSATLRFARVLDYRPDQGAGFVSLAPAVLMNAQDLPATGLIQPGSRVTYAGLFAGPAGAVAAFRAYLIAHQRPGERLRDVGDSSRQLNSAIDRAGRFLSLASLASVLLAAVAVAMATRRYAARHVDAVALMKCLGASQRLVLSVAAVELSALAVAAVAAGAALGFLGESTIAWLLRGLIERHLPAASPLPVAVAFATVFVMLAGFALPPLLQLKSTPPLRVLRRTAEPPPLRQGLVYALAIAALFAILWLMVRDPLLVAYLSAGVAGVGLALAAAGYALVRLTGRFRGAVGVAWRYGLANVSRRGAASVIQVVAFGLGLMVLLLLVVVRRDLLADWRSSLGAHAPNNFLINIRPEDVRPLRRYLRDRGIGAVRMYPMIRARITAIDSRPIASLRFASARGRMFAEREQNLTWSAGLMPDNRLVAGHWWTRADYGKALVSISTEYRDALQLQVGDELSFDIAGESLTAKVASVRKVRWDSFRPNFFLVLPPRLLDHAAGTYMTSIYLNERERPQLTGLVRRFPTVSVFDVDAILKQIRGIMDRASLAVQYVFLFTLAAGVVVLLAAVQATRDERRYESAILRTLGASRFTVLKGVAAEFIALGFLSGLLAASGATAIGWLLARRLFSLDYTPDPKVWLIGVACGTVLVGASGTLAARRVVNAPPIEGLREDR